MDTKYYKSWPEYLAENPEIDEKMANLMAPNIQGYEEMMFGFIMFLCV